MKKLLIALLALPCAIFAQSHTIAVVPKGSTSNFWKIYEAGARKAAADLKVELIVRAPRFESDIDAQIKMIDYFREKKVSAIVVSPQHKDKLVPVIEQTIDAGIPVIVTDSALASTKMATYIASDNFQTGQLGGRTLAKFLGATTTGEVALLRYVKGSDSSEQREQGVMEELKAGLPEATIIDTYYSSAVLGDAKRACETMLKEHPDLKGIIATTTTSTNGLVRALQALGLAGKIVVVGSTSNDEGLEAVRQGHAKAVIVQNPFEMGYRGVKSAVAIAKGEKLPASQVMDTVLVTKENVDTPEVIGLLHP